MANPLPSSGLIRQVQLPGGGTYQIIDYSTTPSKGYLQDQIDELAEIVGGGVNFSIVWTSADYAAAYPYGPTAEKLAQIPKDVTVYYNNGAKNAKGTLEASSTTKGTFYLIYSKSQAGDKDVYDEYVTITSGTSPVTYSWEKIGDTQIDLSGIVTDVSIASKPSSPVLGTGTTAALSSNVVTFGTGNVATVLTPSVGLDLVNPTVCVTPSTTYLRGSATGAGYSAPTISYLTASRATDVAVGANGSVQAITDLVAHYENAISAVNTTVSKLVTTTVPNVTGTSDVSVPSITSVGTSSTWSFTVGGDGGETLIIGGANSTVPTLGAALTATKVTMGTAKTVATGSITSNGGGGSLVTGVSSNTAAYITSFDSMSKTSVLTGVSVTTQPTFNVSYATTGTVSAITALGTFTQPTISILTSTTSGTGKVKVLTGISSATATGGSVTVNTTPTGATASALTSGLTATVGTGITITPATVNALTDVTLDVTKGG